MKEENFINEQQKQRKPQAQEIEVSTNVQGQQNAY